MPGGAIGKGPLGKFRVPEGIDLRCRRGWIRVWAVASWAWVVFVVSQTVPPWALPSDFHTREFVDGDVEPNALISQIAAKADCIPAHTKSQIEPTQFVTYSGTPVRLEEFLAKREADKDAEQAQRGKDVIVECVTAPRRSQAWREMVIVALGPPIAVPLALWLGFLILRALGVWLVVGFRVSRLGQRAVPQVVAENGERESGPSNKPTLRQDQPPSVGFVGLSKVLSWSVLAATMLDYTARAMASGGTSHGTNLLLFVAAGVTVYIGARAYSAFVRKQPKSSVAPAVTFWLLAVGIMGLTVGRYL